ncbi:hypothetical protein ILYODFUR_031828 [Ilyodon furcidens]|uniref:Uncharacterized protein n=1 Tax=Ilyodon furcidens TaxID=33524 RepID=A0ABV0U003_9TELE
MENLRPVLSLNHFNHKEHRENISVYGRAKLEETPLKRLADVSSAQDGPADSEQSNTPDMSHFFLCKKILKPYIIFFSFNNHALLLVSVSHKIPIKSNSVGGNNLTQK